MHLTSFRGVKKHEVTPVYQKLNALYSAANTANSQAEIEADDFSLAQQTNAQITELGCVYTAALCQIAISWLSLAAKSIRGSDKQQLANVCVCVCGCVCAHACVGVCVCKLPP